LEAQSRRDFSFISSLYNKHNNSFLESTRQKANAGRSAINKIFFFANSVLYNNSTKGYNYQNLVQSVNYKFNDVVYFYNISTESTLFTTNNYVFNTDNERNLSVCLDAAVGSDNSELLLVPVYEITNLVNFNQSLLQNIVLNGEFFNLDKQLNNLDFIDANLSKNTISTITCSLLLALKEVENALIGDFTLQILSDQPIIRLLTTDEVCLLGDVLEYVPLYEEEKDLDENLTSAEIFQESLLEFYASNRALL
jgi:hypothetical protein